MKSTLLFCCENCLECSPMCVGCREFIGKVGGVGSEINCYLDIDATDVFECEPDPKIHFCAVCTEKREKEEEQ